MPYHQVSAMLSWETSMLVLVPGKVKEICGQVFTAHMDWGR